MLQKLYIEICIFCIINVLNPRESKLQRKTISLSVLQISSTHSAFIQSQSWKRVTINAR